MDWNSPIENEGNSKPESKLLPDGEYRFGVIDLTKEVSDNPKLIDKDGNPAPIAVMNIAIFALDDVKYTSQLATVRDQLVLHSKCEWKLCEFFVAIGDRKHGERYQPKWDQVPGACGRCSLKVDSFTRRDKTIGHSNKIDKYLDPDPVPAAEQQPAAPAASAEPAPEKTEF